MVRPGGFTKLERAAFVSRILLGILFAAAGALKAVSMQDFVLTVTAYGIIPRAYVSVFAATVVSAEISFGLSFTFGFFTRLSAAVLSILSLVFLTAMAIEIVRGSNAECGCFGVMVHEKIGVASALRDSVLLSVSI